MGRKEKKNKLSLVTTVFHFKIGTCTYDGHYKHDTGEMYLYTKLGIIWSGTAKFKRHRTRRVQEAFRNIIGRYID